MLREVRLGLALNGGVSLAIWIGGVADEFLRAVSASEGHPEAQPEWVELCDELDLVVQVDVIVGTSAGGVNGAFLAVGLANDAPNLVALQDLWIDRGDFSQLLHPPRSGGARSLLRGDDFFLPSLQEALEAVAATGRGERNLDPPLDLRLTATNLRGRIQDVSDGESVLHSVDHAVEFRFTDEDFHFSGEAPSSARVARACRSTASFPGAFEASAVPDGLFEPRHAPALAVDGSVAATFLVDGGVLNNLPARNAVEAIAAQPAGERVYRVLALVVPDPVGQAEVQQVVPLLGRTVGQSTVSIPRNQSLSAFVGEIRDFNNEVLSRRAARAAFLGELGELDAAAAWTHFLGLSEALFPSYRAARHRRSCDRLLARLSDRLTPELAALLVEVAADAESVTLPWIPAMLEDRPGDYWGGSPVRRIVAQLVTWTNLAASLLLEAGDQAGARELLASKRELGRIRAEADTYAPIGSVDDLLLDEVARRPGRPDEALREALQRWSDADQVHELDGLVGRMAAHLGHVVEAVRPHVSTGRSEAELTVAGLVRLYDGAGPARIARLLLGVEVVELAFGPADPPPDQIIRLAHFTADEGVTVDPAGRDDPEEKLAGVQLAHFAAFLKRSWRANDWMWGRLDAAERLVRLLDEATDHELTTTGRLDHHLRALQSAVLRDLLPVVAAEIDADGVAGAYVSPEARRFADAVRAAGTATTEGRVSLAGVSQDELSRLLALNLVGLERLAGEVGNARVSTLMLNAVTTAAALVRSEAPRGTRTVAAWLSGVSTAAWRWRQVPMARRRVVIAVVTVLGLLGAGVVMAGQRGSDVPGWLTVLAWLLVAVCVVLLAGRLALYDIRHRTRSAPAPPPSPTTRP